jgi:predicted RNase H-like HicB family nuclease
MMRSMYNKKNHQTRTSSGELPPPVPTRDSFGTDPEENEASNEEENKQNMEVDELKFNDPHLTENWAEIYPPTPPPSGGSRTAAFPQESDDEDGSYSVESLEAPGAVHVGGNVEETDNLASTAGETIIEAKIAADPAYQDRQEAHDEAQDLRQQVHLMERERENVFAIAVESNKTARTAACPRESDDKDGSYSVESLEAPGAVHVGGNVEETDNLASCPRESDDEDGSYSVESLEAPGAVHVGGNVEETDNLASTAGETIIEAEIAADPEEAIVAAYQDRQEALDEAQDLRQQVHLMERERIDVFVIAVESNKKRERRRCILTYCSFILIAVVIAGGVSAGVLLSGRSDSEAFSTPPPTSSTSSPTQFLLYPPPGEEQCMKVANDQQVDGQEQMILKRFEVLMQITLDTDTNFNLLIPELEEKLQSVLMPAVVGCGVEEELQNNKESDRSVIPTRYVVANGEVVSMTSWHIGNCNGGPPQVCYQLIAVINLFLNGEESNITLLNVVVRGLGIEGDENVVAALNLRPPFSKVLVLIISPILLTGAVTSAPTMLPTAS